MGAPQAAAELMCLSDGSGAMVGSIDARAKELADLHATDHFGAYLDFYCPRPPGRLSALSVS